MNLGNMLISCEDSNPLHSTHGNAAQKAVKQYLNMMEIA